jgi:localization factor PodJL
VQRAVETFTAEPQPEEAVSVKAPAGGWDNVAAAPAAKPKSASETPRKIGPS